MELTGEQAEGENAVDAGRRQEWGSEDYTRESKRRLHFISIDPGLGISWLVGRGSRASAEKLPLD